MKRNGTLTSQILTAGHLFTAGKLLAVGILFTGTLFFYSCDGKSPSSSSSVATKNLPPAKPFLDSALAKKLPPTTYGYIFWDLERPSAKRYAEFVRSSYGADFSLKDTLQEMLPDEGTTEVQNREQLEAAVEIASWLADEGFLPLVPNQESSMTQGVAFVELKDDLPLPGFGMYLDFKPNTPLDEKLKELKALLESKGGETRELTGKFSNGFAFSGAKNKSGTKDAAQQQGPSPEVMVATNGKMVSIASSQPLLERAFTADDAENGATKIQASAPYQRLRAQYRGADEFAFAYFDLERLIQKVSSLVPAEQKSELPFELDELPVQAASARLSYTNVAQSDFGILFDDAKVKNNQTLSMALQSGVKDNGFSLAPTDSVFFMGLNGSLLKASKKVLEEQTTKEERAQYENLLASLESLKGIHLGVLPTDGSTVFPGVFLQLSSSKDAGTAELLKTKISDLATQQGVPATAWQAKDIEGLSTNYLLTPLGLGIFLASDDSNIMISSSEYSMRKIVQAKKGGNKTLFSELPSDLQQKLEQGPLMVAYFNAERTVELLKSVQSSFSMFTQGQDPFPPEQLEEIRKAGTSYTLASYGNGLLNFSGLNVPTGKTAS